MPDVHVLVTGIPGSGKSTLAKALATALGLPLLSKDELRGILFDTLKMSRQDSMQRSAVGLAAVRIQYHLIATMPPMVVDCGLWTYRSEPELLATARRFVQVFCSCPFEIGKARTRERHPDEAEVFGGEYERFRPLSQPLRLNAPVIVVPTDQPYDICKVADDVRRALAEGNRSS